MPNASRPAERLNVGVDALNLLHDRRGIGRYTRALLRRWVGRDAHRVHVVLLVPHALPALTARQLGREIGVDRPAVDSRRRSPRSKFDIVWHPWNGIFFRSGSRDVATIHDVWPFVDAPAEDSRAAQHRQQPFVDAAARAVRLITDSDFSKREIVRHLGVGPDRIDVVPLGVDTALPKLVAAPTNIPGAKRYVLFVGETEGRKDLATLLSAMAKLPDRLRAETPLVISGRLASSTSVPSGVRVEFTDEVSDVRLAALYAGAAVFAFPSRYEGFGLPVLEAMHFGAPVVASNAASIPEAGGDAALYFPAGDAAACADALLRVLTDARLAADLRERGFARAAAMTWDRCAAATLDILERAARS